MACFAGIFKAATPKPDTTLSMMVYWKIKDKDAFVKGCADFIKLTKNEEGNKYYGFTINGMDAVCKEGYVSAVAFLAHLQNVDGPLKEALKIADITSIEAHGPAVELDQLKKPLSDFPVTYWPYMGGQFYIPAKYKGCGRSADTTLNMMVYWKIKNKAVFDDGLKAFTLQTQSEKQNVYYGFTSHDNGMFHRDSACCKEGYTSAQAFLDHLQNVDGPLKQALKVSDITKIEAHGTAAELEKLKEPLKDFPVTFWAYVAGANFNPAAYGS